MYKRTVWTINIYRIHIKNHCIPYVYTSIIFVSWLKCECVDTKKKKRIKFVFFSLKVLSYNSMFERACRWRHFFGNYYIITHCSCVIESIFLGSLMVDGHGKRGRKALEKWLNPLTDLARLFRSLSQYVSLIMSLFSAMFYWLGLFYFLFFFFTWKKSV